MMSPENMGIEFFFSVFMMVQKNPDINTLINEYL